METAMLKNVGNVRTALAVAVLVIGATSLAAAEEKSADQILNALKPKAVTRSLTGGAPVRKTSPEDQRFVDSLRGKTTRSLSGGDRDRVAAIAKEKPSIDLEINFQYNSAAITGKAVAAVAELGKALSNPDLKGGVFLVAGHTDAKGADQYNQILSERRAEAIRQYLMQKYGIAGDNLVAVGYGKTQLKNTANPLADENRRVQVVNMEASKEAKN
jgi:outer membrane protein OmpA-like peptidoglycan-associated protein